MDAVWAWLQTSNWPAHEPWTLITILLMGGVTVLARSFFFISQTPWHLPRWAQRGAGVRADCRLVGRGVA